MKNIKRLLFIVMCICLLCGCDKTKNNSDALRFKEEYEALNGTKREKDGKKIRSLEIDEDNPFIYSDASEIIKKMNNKETFVVYFGFTDCPWCRSIINNMIDVSYDLDIKEVYYVNVKSIRDVMEIDENGNIVTSDSGTDGYYELIDRLADVLSDYNLKDNDGNTVATGEKRIYAPNIVSIVKGEAVSMTDGISDDENDPYMIITDKMNEDSYEKIKCTMKCVSDAKEVCTKTC